jgi:signal transduction histidine kinase
MGKGGEVLRRTLYDITQLLASADGAEARVRRVLHLLRELVPYDQCAMLETQLGRQPEVVVVPDRPPDERAPLTARLAGILGLLVETNAHRGTPAARTAGAHLVVPMVGLDEVIGLLLVESSTVEHTEEHRRALSVVAAMLAAYVTMLRARAELADLAHQRSLCQRAAEAANQAKDEFLALVSHELRAPLGSILACAHSLRSTIDDAAARALAIEELERNVQAQARLVDGILDLASVTCAGLRLNLRVVQPAPLIAQTIEGLRQAARSKSIRLAAELDAGAMPLVLDPARIGQVISILVTNAINFTPVGGQVDVRLERACGYARIQVRDSVGAIAPHAPPPPLDGTPQAAGPRARSEGGFAAELRMVKDLVELHGGCLRAGTTDENEGATFTVDLPRLPETRGPAGRHPAGPRPDDQLAGIRVLLVDHDLGLRESLQWVLEDYGAHVTAVASAPDALILLERWRPDVVLFGDLAIRSESVYDHIREVTAQSSPLPVASLSAWRLEEREREVAGLQLHLTKPVDIGTLVDAIAGLAERARH